MTMVVLDLIYLTAYSLIWKVFYTYKFLDDQVLKIKSNYGFFTYSIHHIKLEQSVEILGFGYMEIKAAGESTAVLSMAGLLFKK